LLSRRRLPPIRDEAVETDAQEGPEAGARRGELVEEALLERAREELLRDVGRLFAVAAPLEADIFVDRLPIRLDERVPSHLARLRVAAPHRFADGEARRRKGRRARGRR